MNKPNREKLDAYYREAGSWAADRQEALRSSRRVAWIVAGVAAAIALLEAIALVVLTPLKTVVPYTLLVDRQTGFVQALKPLDSDKVAPDTALTQSFLVQYVIARESFDIDSLQTNYRKVALWSAEKAKSEYLAGVQGTNPESPLRRYPRNTVVETRIKSVSALGRNVALVRFDTGRRDAGGQYTPLGAWVAIIRYRFTTDPLSAEDRYVNPLGFQVVRYQRNAEALPPAETQPPAVVVSPGGTTIPSATPGTTVIVPVPAPGRAPVQGQISHPARPDVEL
ncbi:MAG TPA: VirB8/TrbF family protein [Allosphingosinicella sp.]|jgi:type IV secretion system protein VirB8